MDMIYERISDKPLAEVRTRLKAELALGGFGVLYELNFRDKLKEKDLDLPFDFYIMDVCNPKKAFDVLTKHADVGYFLPCKTAVYEKDGKVRAGIIAPKALIGMFGYGELDEVASEVERILKTAVDGAV